MEEIFLKQLKVNNVRHLSDIDIVLSETERKHLILTGKNGSGKTSVVEVLRDYFELIEVDSFKPDQIIENIRVWENAINTNKHLEQNLLNWREAIKRGREQLKELSKLEFRFTNFDIIHTAIKEGEFMFAYFQAQRGRKFNVAKGPLKLDFGKQPNTIKRTLNEHFLQYLVNLKTERSFAKDEQDIQGAESIDKWFITFESLLKEIYGEEVRLEFDRKDWNFYLRIEGHERFDFNHLSDGYSAIINIISELLLRMEKHDHWSHEMQGIVLIDEIETHLHIALQKKILPFLTTFFPKIQFIVTSHSPFVLSSINNAVIFDLEKKERIEDMSGFSVENIIEGYFDADQYSDFVKKKVELFEELADKKNIEGDDAQRLEDLEKYFNKFPISISPELSLKINNIRLKKIA